MQETKVEGMIYGIVTSLDFLGCMWLQLEQQREVFLFCDIEGEWVYRRLRLGSSLYLAFLLW